MDGQLLKKGLKCFLPEDAFEDYGLTKVQVESSLKETPGDWSEEVMYEVQIIRCLKVETVITATLKEF